ncbi:D-alanyl-D-alanine carboxypeptidase [Photobacterium sanctipauli]|uniref:serine-type D-Ala-D-Ala carboxypeptidase n=1 Tax=Photobacterium sanctipauli TaxID=1342794 RepID=A0A2T3NUF5_9GAMM|nr:D-alanyl-D-alanine carboxypeptidase family protein [Photobacterium sanctipauli]PSW19926.1 D-alanyl-D-alanine carboxypeptidase [Photobacterium sanctipauli]
MKNNKLITVGFSVLIATLPITGLAQLVPAAPEIAAKGYVLMDYHSGKILASGNVDQPMAPASLAKMMTAYVIGQEINNGRLSLDDEVVVGESAWSVKFPDSSKMFIQPGDTIAVSNLARGIMVQSGNDASVAMAEHIAGSEGAFVSLMNSWAKSLGMTNTRYINAHGLDGEGIATSPRDMATLLTRMIQDTPDIYSIYKEKSFTWNDITQYNRNKLLWDRSLNVDGAKTGYTPEAGYSLTTSATDGRMRLVSVVMGTSSQQARVAETRKLLNYGFRFYDTKPVAVSGEALGTETVWLGESDELEYSVADDIYLTLPKSDYGKLTVSYKLENAIIAPVKQGEKIGTVTWSVDEDIVREAPLIASKAVEPGSWYKRLMDMVKLKIKSLLTSLFDFIGR